MEVTTIFDSDRAEYEYMQEQKEKQAIEEMAKVIEKTEQIARDAHCGLPSPTMYAKDLYWHGYHKQSEGEWIKTQFRSRSGFYTIKEFPCNKCGEKFEVAKGNENMHFCPNCGAHMKGGAE